MLTCDGMHQAFALAIGKGVCSHCLNKLRDGLSACLMKAIGAYASSLIWKF